MLFVGIPHPTKTPGYLVDKKSEEIPTWSQLWDAGTDILIDLKTYFVCRINRKFYEN